MMRAEPPSYHDGEVYSFENVYIGSRGIIYDRHKNVIPVHPNHKKRPVFKFDERREVIELPDGDYLNGFHWHNQHVWGHFREILARLYSFQSDKYKDCVLLSNFPNFNRKEHMEHFKAFGYAGRTLRLKAHTNDTTGAYYRVPRLYHAWGWSHVDNKSHRLQLNKERLSYIKTKWFEHYDIRAVSPYDDAPTYKLYLSRPSKRTFRCVNNNEEVVDFLREKEFTIFTGKEGFKEHLKMFRNAEIIIGAHGGAFFNTLFCELNPLVLEFMPQSRRVGMWKGQANLMQNISHYHIISSPDDKRNHHNININTIKEYL